MTTDRITIDAVAARSVKPHRTRLRHRATRIPAWGIKFRKVLVATDFLAITVGVLLSIALVTPRELTLVGMFSLPYPAVAAILGFAWLLSLGAGATRNPWITGAGVEEYMRVIKASLYVFGGIAIASYILKAQFARSLFIALLPIGTLLLLFGRWIARAWINRTRIHGKNLASCAVVGPTAQVERVVSDLRRHTDAGLQPIGVCLLDSVDEPTIVDGIPSYSPSQLLGTASSTTFDAVIATEGLPDGYLRELTWNLEGSSTSLVVTPRVMDIVGRRAHYSDAPGVSLIHVDIPEFTGWKYGAKRAFDIAFSTTALIVLAPAFLIIGILIKLDDHGPVIFKQERIGLNGQPFTMYKFRSMCVNAEQQVTQLIDDSGGQKTLFKMRDDPRVTRIGKTLRRYSLDELPQFWSTFHGEMSVVGPRPALPREVAVYSPTSQRRLLVKPGITGLWQVSGRSDLSPEESVRIDLGYVANWSLIGDVAIVLKTVVTAIKGSGAY